MKVKAWAVAAAALALVAAGCGGSSKNAGAGSTATTGTGSGDAASILSGVSSTAATGPAKISLNLSLTVTGTPKSAQYQALLSKPVTFKVDGVSDNSSKKIDATFTLAAGALNIPGALRSDGKTTWLQLAGKWYTLPSSAAGASGSSGTTGSAGLKLDTSALIRDFGRPSALVQSAHVVGTEDVGGVSSDHVQGQVATATLVAGLSKALSSSTAKSTPVPTAQLQSAVVSIRKYVKQTTVDVWVGQSDKQVHRLDAKIVGAVNHTAQASSGVSGFTLDFGVTSVPASAPTITAPPNPAPYSQLQQALGGLIGGVGTGSGSSSSSSNYGSTGP
jgi:hypothetical protein